MSSACRPNATKIRARISRQWLYESSFAPGNASTKVISVPFRIRKQTTLRTACTRIRSITMQSIMSVEGQNRGTERSFPCSSRVACCNPNGNTTIATCAWCRRDGPNIHNRNNSKTDTPVIIRISNRVAATAAIKKAVRR